MGQLPPANTRRWVVRRKAAVVAAVQSGKITLEEACQRSSRRLVVLLIRLLLLAIPEQTPPLPLVLFSGSASIARGRPSSRKAWSATGRNEPIVSGTIRHSIRKLLSASVIVSGSQRCPSAVPNPPLKSTHHRSFGSCTGRKGWVSGVACGDTRRWEAGDFTADRAACLARLKEFMESTH